MDALLAEVEADRDIGRIRGPFAAPEKWGVEAVHPRDNHKGKNELLPRPSDDACYAAFAFPIEQIGSDGSGKVRRGEDWLRSGHNVQATTLDKPVHYTVDHQVECARRLKRRRLPKAVTWGQDHEGAYRQLPGRPRSVMWMILMTMYGPTLWQHLMTLFGSKAAVWAYNRFGDAIMHVVRIMLCLLLVHYVDDYSGVDPEPIAPSGFHAFEDVMQLLGVMLKESKRQPPAVERETTGVNLGIYDKEAVVSPKTGRRDKIGAFVQKALCDDDLGQKAAESLAGKVNHFNTAVYGRLGRAALRAIYRRSRFGGRKLGTDLVASLQSVRHLLMEAPPRRIPLMSGDEIAPLLYADAFFVQDGKRWRFRDLDPNAHNTKPFLESLTPETTNGWGVVVARVGAPTLFAWGSVPSYVLARLKKKKHSYSS